MSTGFMNFKEEQKAAIIGTLIAVAQCDGQVHPKEEDALNQTAEIMGFDATSPYMAKMHQGGFGYMLSILKGFDKSQKEWFILTMHSLMHADGHVAEKEVTYCLGIAEQIGISQNEYKSILDKMDGLYNAFLK